MAVVEKTSSFKSLTALSDSEGRNNSSLNGRQYRDLDLFFTKRSTDKDVNTLSNVQAVKRSVRNLVLTNFYEKPFQVTPCLELVFSLEHFVLEILIFIRISGYWIFLLSSLFQ